MARSGFSPTPNDGQRASRGPGPDGTDRPAPAANAAPTVSLPKGGGAIRGIGEKFAANPVTGTASMSVPIAVSPGRSGFGPQLSLSYDSGSGNGCFGFGWSLALPSITRKTDQGLPQYDDAEESDTFVLSGAEDLVPELDANGKRVSDTASAPEYTIFRYRPRIEGSFARIERWQRNAGGDVHWRSISRDNLLTIYGKDAGVRIADPADPRRVFSWLICETRDDKGNAVLYDYRHENSDRVDADAAHEANRTTDSRAANRYVKRIRYGNRVSLLGPDGRRPLFLTPAAIENAGWMFEAVFDYGEHDADAPRPRDDEQDGHAWACRRDPFSSYRAGFDVRTYRRCQRVLMFHHFPDEEGVGADCLVRSTDFAYREVSDEVEDPSRVAPIASFITAVTQRGYTRRGDTSYTSRSLPPIEFEYSEVVIHGDVQEIDADSLANLPAGLDGTTYRWVDLDGEGVAGILTDQGDGWFYKRNLGDGRFGPVELVARKPSTAALAAGRQQLLDLAGGGQLDLVDFSGSAPGFFERTGGEDWTNFTPFSSLPNIPWDAPNVRVVDLNGDGLADVLIDETDVFTWYPSLAREGFGPGRTVHQPSSEEQGPRLIVADRGESIYAADMSGDGLSDLVRVRNGEICYWPNLGYGRFGARVTMDDAPVFDHPDQFDQKRVRLADIDGSGTNDIIYLGRQGVALYFNECGNRWSAARPLASFPPIDDVVAVTTADLLGNGTACLVWSSSLPADEQRQVRYIDLMGGTKPHLLVRTVNNLGAETRVQYASSTKFSLADRAAGKPWITRLPFPVYVVERVDTYDYVGRNRFVTSYAYHHGYFDGVEREFRGFGLVEQRDTEEFSTLAAIGAFPAGSNLDVTSHVPPVYTKTWFHTGVHTGGGRVSDYFAGLLDERDRGEYYREPAWRDDDEQAREHLLPDTELPAGLTLEEEREACRALKGAMLRQEVYALDATAKAEHPYTVTEQSFAVRRLQGKAGGRPGVFFTHARETITYQYERNPSDPRVRHSLTIEVDDFGNVRKSALAGYGRRQVDSTLPLDDDRRNQSQAQVTFTETEFTNAIAADGSYRTPLEAETRAYELTGYTPTGAAGRFRISDFSGSSTEIPYEAAPTTGRERRLIEHVRTVYRPNDLGASAADADALLPVGTIESLALPGDVYTLAFTPGLLLEVYRRRRDGQPPENLLPDVPHVLGSAGYVPDGDGRWWMPSGRVFFSADADQTPAQELAFARDHFFIPRRYRDPFHTGATPTEAVVTYDGYDLLVRETRDPLGNRITVGERRPAGEIDPDRPGNDYRVLQSRIVTDANRNRMEVSFDALGLVVGTAVTGKDDTVGDSFIGFDADPSQNALDTFADDPLASAAGLLQRATTRIVYDLDRFHRTRQANPADDTLWLPAFAATLSRETHATEAPPPQGVRIQISFTYSDGFGREIQKKIQAEPGPLLDGGPVESPRWIGSGWTVFNNKGKTVRQFEPFFSRLTARRHQFEFGVQAGVSPILFYDPLDRIVATINPDHSYQKVVFDAWQRSTYDSNDTVAPNGAETGDPRTDPDIGGYVAAYFATVPAFLTWHQERAGGALGSAEQRAAQNAAAHANTPTVVHFDTLGRPFLTLAHNGFELDGTPLRFPTRVTIDIEGNQREVRDAIVQNGEARGRLVMRYDYDMLGNRLHQQSMDAGERWVLNDVAGKPVRTWNSLGHDARTEYDALRRPLRTFVLAADPQRPTEELLVDRLIYGEQHPENELRNLRGHLYLRLDQAGAVSTDLFDFKGNSLLTSRRLARESRQAADWQTVDAAIPTNGSVPFNAATLENALAALLETHTFTGRAAYDALNRQIQWVPPRSAEAGDARHVVQPVYNEASLVERIDVWLDRPVDPDVLLDPTAVFPSPVGVSNIDYNARGQRVRLDYKNGATTLYLYDPNTFRLRNLHTDAGGTTDLQDLHYTYDPAGNIVDIHDDAQQTLFFRNRRVEPSAEYTYDPLYRLVEATGREHLGQVGGAPITHSYNDAPRVGIAWSANDGNAMGRYVERYRYDAAGNLLEMRHIGTDPAQTGWTRTFEYDDPGNRLSRSTVGAGTPENYTYDAHGNVLRMPQLQNVAWDFKDQLRLTERQAVDDDDADGLDHDGERTYYVYDSAGVRVRKITEHGGGQVLNERIYIGGIEVFRRSGVTPVVRETLQLTATGRLALVDSRIQGSEPGVPAQLTRYQLGNHLGSASLELDDHAAIVSYEEYTPFGSTSYQAVESVTQTPKRYRYAGRERDEECGLYYQGARYYAPWLARWTSADPMGIEDSLNVFAYVRNNPVARVDASGMDTLNVVTTDNFRALLRASIEKAGNFTPTDKKLDELSGKYMKSYESNKPLSAERDPILDEFKLRMDLFGRKTTTLKDFKPPGWEDAGGNEEACFKLACAGTNQTAKAGETATGGGGVILYEAVKQRIKTDKTASDLALSQIRRHIDSGRAVLAGVNEPGHGGQVDAKTQPVTDHFVAIYGYETDAKGNVKALFAKDNAVAGTAEVRFTVNEKTGEITKPVEKRPKGQEYLNQEYQLSEVRFNSSLPYTGDLKPENDAKQIMYWPVKKDDADKDKK